MKTGYNGRRRFSLLYPDGRIERWGCCDPKIDSGRTIKEHPGGILYLTQDTRGLPFGPVDTLPLVEEIKACNGYYDHEHDGWIPVREYYERFVK